MFIVLLILSLITYSFSDVTGVAVDLKASQSVNTGSNVAFKITVTVSGNAAAGSEGNDKVKIKAIAGLLLVKSDDSNTNSTVTCTVSSPTQVVRGTPKDFDCTAQSLTTAATYKLAGDKTDFQLTDNTDTKIATAAVTGTVTMAVTAAAGSDAATPTTGGDTTTGTTGSGKFLAVSSLFTLLLFF
jgi:hypothetical protein